QVAHNVPVVGRVAGPLVGTTLLSDRDPVKAEVNEQGQVVNRPMLVPAVGDSLDNWTLPRRSHRRRGANADPEFFEDSEGEMLTVTGPERIRPRRMGTFTPTSPAPETTPTSHDSGAIRQRERSEYAAEMQGEEMEQHISDTLRAHTGTHSTLGGMLSQDRGAGSSDRLEQAAEALLRAAQMQMQVMLGQLKVTGVPDVAGVMGDVVGQVRSERQQAGQPANTGADHLQVADHMARVMGVTPQA